MKTLFKAIAVASLATTGVAQALEGSIGAANEYTFRGETLATDGIYSASAGTNVAGLDVGIALVDADGYFERNLMVGYGLNIAGVDIDLGYTNYSYGEGSDDEEDEISVGMTASGVTITYVDGEDSNAVGGDFDYNVLSFGYTVGGMDITVGAVERDGDGAAYDAVALTGNGAGSDAEFNYYEISTGTEVAGLDATVTLTNTFSEEGIAAQDARIVVGVSKALSL
jgi:hypothetical protein